MMGNILLKSINLNNNISFIEHARSKFARQIQHTTAKQRLYTRKTFEFYTRHFSSHPMFVGFISLNL